MMVMMVRRESGYMIHNTYIYIYIYVCINLCYLLIARKFLVQGFNTYWGVVAKQGSILGLHTDYIP